MNDERLKDEIGASLWRVVDRHNSILSATLTGSFVNSTSLEGLSDIDFVVIVDQLNQANFGLIQRDFEVELKPVLARAGYQLKINPTLGPLKFNEPKLAVLHLMLYSQAAHVEHVIQSPFTCLDWQTSNVWRKCPLSDVYPTFGLQPRHFISARRSISDYLRDYRESVVSYRKLLCDSDNYQEQKCSKPMDNRDRHEFAYHVMRFLMLNLLKLVHRTNYRAVQLQPLMDQFFQLFPLGQNDARLLLQQLAERKRKIDYATPVDGLDRRLETFMDLFEQQFRAEFVENVSKHLVLRHAPTAANLGPVRFLGRSNPAIVPEDFQSNAAWQQARNGLSEWRSATVYASPLQRCLETLSCLGFDKTKINTDDRLIEIDYGQCEMLTVEEGRARFPRMFEEWQARLDTPFPDGENSADVAARVSEFAAEKWRYCDERSVTCTHNVVVRNLVGELLNVPLNQRYRLHIPHMAPIELVATRRFGLFANLSEALEREMFRDFVLPTGQLKLAC